MLRKNRYLLMRKFRSEISIVLKFQPSIHNLDGDSFEPMNPIVVQKTLKQGEAIQSGN